MALNRNELVKNEILHSSDFSLNEYLDMTQFTGNPAKAVAFNLRGISQLGVKGMVPENRDSYGLSFFTRPQLCLNEKNLRNDRMFYNLLTNESRSIMRYIRCMLDPRQARDPGAMITSPFVDEELGFITVLTNNITSMSGWPDITLDSYTSPQGMRREAWSIADAPIDIVDAFDINCTFRNTKDEPIIMMMYYWIRYMSLVFEGMMSPYLDFITENEIDYNTRIYRLVLDENKRFVKKISATGASFPTSVPYGKFFDFQDMVKYNTQTKDIDITFKCNGANYNDPILIDEFNAVQGIFNRNMRISKETKRAAQTSPGKVPVPSFSGLEKIPFDLLESFNFRGYPYINPETLELEWYISTSSQYYQTAKRAFAL